MDEILTIQEAAALLKFCTHTIAKLAMAGKIPAKKLGGQWRFSRLALEQFIAAPTASRLKSHRKPLEPATEVA
jgi:excisionase family DNA binding protein